MATTTVDLGNVRGQAATVQVGTVTAGDTPSVTNSGTANDAVLDFVLPSGGGMTLKAVGHVTISKSDFLNVVCVNGIYHVPIQPKRYVVVEIDEYGRKVYGSVNIPIESTDLVIVTPVNHPNNIVLAMTDDSYREPPDGKYITDCEIGTGTDAGKLMFYATKLISDIVKFDVMVFSTNSNTGHVCFIPYEPRNAPVLLWSGSWTSGSITVPNFSAYRLFVGTLLITTQGVDAVFAHMDGTTDCVAEATFFGSASYTLRVIFEPTGDTLTMQARTTTGQTKPTLTAIYGIL